MYNFKLDELQIADLEAWQKQIKDLYGKFGDFSYTFYPTGIGTKVIVKSDLTGLEKDISHYERW